MWFNILSIYLYVTNTYALLPNVHSIVCHANDSFWGIYPNLCPLPMPICPIYYFGIPLILPFIFLSFLIFPFLVEYLPVWGAFFDLSPKWRCIFLKKNPRMRFYEVPPHTPIFFRMDPPFCISPSLYMYVCARACVCDWESEGERERKHADKPRAL